MRKQKSILKSKRTRNRRRNLVAISLTAGVLLVLVFVLLSLTVFFKLDTFSFVGNTPYSDERITEISGLQIGENLLRLDEEEAEKRILANLPYIETVKVTVKLPATVIIETTAAEEYAYVREDKNCYIINSKGRVLKKSDMIYDGLIELTDVLPPEKTLAENGAEGNRTYVKFADEKTAEAFETLSNELSSSSLKVTRISLQSYLDVVFIVENRVRVELGSVVDMDYKMKYVRRLFEDGSVPSDGYVILDVSNTDRVSLKTNAAGNITEKDIFG